jgi:hypothetical protein
VFVQQLRCDMHTVRQHGADLVSEHVGVQMFLQ